LREKPKAPQAKGNSLVTKGKRRRNKQKGRRKGNIKEKESRKIKRKQPCRGGGVKRENALE